MSLTQPGDLCECGRRASMHAPDGGCSRFTPLDDGVLPAPAGTHIPDRQDTSPGDLQQRTGSWHRRRFPAAQMFHVALKATEEMGEVAQAVNGVLSDRDAATSRGGTVAEEAADVVIALLALVDRWCPGADLLAEVERKLVVLTDPTSGHRSALIDGGAPS